MNFHTLLDTELERCALLMPEWADTLRGCAARFSNHAHGDFVRWQTAIEQLQPGGAQEVALRELIPWRKGPWQLDGVFIDTEWRSDWKWARIAPHLPDLQGAKILDVGCGNGWFGWQMLHAGAAAVIGIDPTLLYCMQHLAVTCVSPRANNFVLPLALEETPDPGSFDLVFSMGVIYHRKDASDHVHRLASKLRPGGTVVLESLIVEGSSSLRPAGRYARMRNVPIVPSIADLEIWLATAGFESIRVADVTPTTVDEQHTTDWMPFESLQEALDPKDSRLTVDGHPAPLRAVLLAQRVQ